MSDIFKQRKGQLAIEYLMTYGWMLLVVAIVGGAIFATIQGQCVSSVTNKHGEELQITNVGVQAGENENIELVFENKGQDPAEITNLVIRDKQGTEGTETILAPTWYGTYEVNPQETKVIEVDQFANIAESDSCNEFFVEVTYNQGLIDKQVIEPVISIPAEIS